jgi:DNA-directed RNA polymerase specialized sigma24 family protein
VARIEWVKHRLENWALWKERESRGGLGWATQSVLLSDVVDRTREIQLPVDDIDASLTDKAVESLKPARQQLYERLYLIYIDGVGVREAARRQCCAESTIKASLDQADHALSAWFGEYAESRPKVTPPASLVESRLLQK